MKPIITLKMPVRISPFFDLLKLNLHTIGEKKQQFIWSKIIDRKMFPRCRKTS